MNINFKEYLTHTEKLINHIYWFYSEFEIEPKKEHLGLSINYSDIKERRTHFLEELLNTIIDWVYNKAKAEELIGERMKETSLTNAANFLTNQAYSKFRPGHPQGQFGELLLFNLLQHFFSAVPILRKQRISTTTGHERFGADAIHYAKNNETNLLILGESKCYKSKYQFINASETSLDSIIHTFNNLDKELNLYIYDDFLEPQLVEIVKKYKDNKLENIRFELVCLIVYNETKTLSGDTEAKIKDSIKKTIIDKFKLFNNEKFKDIDNSIISRINYIIFPIWNLDVLLQEFQNKVGSNVTK